MRNAGVGSIDLELLSTCSTHLAREFIFAFMIDSWVLIVSDICCSISCITADSEARVLGSSDKKRSVSISYAAASRAVKSLLFVSRCINPLDVLLVNYLKVTIFSGYLI